MKKIMGNGESKNNGLIEIDKPHEYKFLIDLSVDHPKVADDILSRTKDWKKAVDKKSGIDGFGQAIVDKMVYIQKKDVKEFIVSILEEVRDIWKKNPDKPIYFITPDGNKGSGKWFYNLLFELLSEEEKKKDIQLRAFHNLGDDENDSDPTYIYMDDSANSGQQVQQGIIALRSIVRAAENGRIDIDKMKDQPVDAKIRLMRMTNKVKSYIENQEKFFKRDEDLLVKIDLDGNDLANKNMPTMDQVIDELGISEEEVESSGLFFTGHHLRRPSILGVFWHRVQDNMSVAMIQGKHSDKFSPLITLENEKQIKIQYE